MVPFRGKLQRSAAALAPSHSSMALRVASIYGLASLKSSASFGAGSERVEPLALTSAYGQRAALRALRLHYYYRGHIEGPSRSPHRLEGVHRDCLRYVVTQIYIDSY